MLKTRIITALLMLPVVLLALFAFPAWAWALFTLGIVLAGCWEWSRLCQMTPRAKLVFLLLSGLIAALILAAYLRIFPVRFDALAVAAFVAAAAFWLLAAPLWLAKNWHPRSTALGAAVGWVVIFPTWFALLTLRDANPWLLLSFAAIVWVADIAAYFVGKALGRTRLAPSISPGKTVEGALGGLIGVSAYFFVWQALTQTAPGANWASVLHAQGLWLLLLFLLLAAISVLGDLFESWMKRGAGLKDSSSLLPGHGGVLDRIDALTSALPIAGLYIMLLAHS
ncbi:MAG TPA: phosphatidate cytidylyltransferase [Usitatibacteraceae bacterium]